jgi:hypothetical protein
LKGYPLKGLCNEKALKGLCNEKRLKGYPLKGLLKDTLSTFFVAKAFFAMNFFKRPLQRKVFKKSFKGLSKALKRCPRGLERLAKNILKPFERPLKDF